MIYCNDSKYVICIILLLFLAHLPGLRAASQPSGKIPNVLDIDGNNFEMTVSIMKI